MDLDVSLVVGGLVLLIGITVAALRPGQLKDGRRKQHNAALAQLAREVRSHTTPTGSGIDALAATLGRTKVRIVPVANSERIRLEAGLRIQGCLCVRGRGVPLPGDAVGTPTPTGDAAFDGEVEVREANAALQVALQDSVLRDWIRRVVVDRGGHVTHDVSMEAPWASSVDALRADLALVVTLARWLSEPRAGHAYHTTSPLVPPFHGFPQTKRARAFLEVVGPQLGSGAVVDGDDGPEWRGTQQRIAVRVVVDDDGVTVELRAPLPITNIELSWIPDTIPTPHRDVWDAAEGDVFVGYGVILSRGYEFGENPKKAFERRSAQWARLPAEVQAEIVTLMSSCDLRELVLDRRGASAQLRPGVSELLHPESQLQRVGQGLVSLVLALAALPASSEVLEAETDHQRLHHARCDYCRSKFVWTHNAICPNCGAPVTA